MSLKHLFHLDLLATKFRGRCCFNMLLRCDWPAFKGAGLSERSSPNVTSSYVLPVNTVDHRCQTRGPLAESGPPHRCLWPLTACKTRDHLFLKKLKKKFPCFYFEGFK